MLILTAQNLTKAFGAQALFRNISFTVNDGDRIALIGPNGSGKSTLMKILAGEIEPDSGEVSTRKRARLAYIAQESTFEPGATVRSVLEEALARAGVAEWDREQRLREIFGRAGFDSLDTEAVTFSGGWRKRLAIVEAAVQQPDILLLDEPTNHLDLAGIEWLEEMLQSVPFACIVVSHDRYFLEAVATETAELSRAYPDGMLRYAGNYSTFLEKKEEYLLAQGKRQEALQNRVRIETDWLRRGPKARTTKSKARIDNANELIGELQGMKQRAATSSAGITFGATDRQTKRLVEFEDLTYSVPEEGGRPLFQNLNFAVTAGMRVGVVGPNGSGKTTLLHLVDGQLHPDSGTIKTANNLRIVYFEQNREIEGTQTLRRALAPDSDSIVYQDSVIHVASWAARFLFTGEQLNQPVERLSGGERARVLIAKLMLEPADLLLLDEPTNDLDIPTLEILEESLLEYKGAMMLVTHDRYMLDRVSNVVLGLTARAARAASPTTSSGKNGSASEHKAPTARRRRNKTARLTQQRRGQEEKALLSRAARVGDESSSALKRRKPCFVQARPGRRSNHLDRPCEADRGARRGRRGTGGGRRSLPTLGRTWRQGGVKAGLSSEASLARLLWYS